MSKPYRAKNKRIIQRGPSGKFRQTNLGDLGVSQCDVFKELYEYDSRAVMSGPFVDPFLMAQHKTKCAKCMHKNTDGLMKRFGFKVLKKYPQHRNALLWMN